MRTGAAQPSLDTGLCALCQLAFHSSLNPTSTPNIERLETGLALAGIGYLARFHFVRFRIGADADPADKDYFAGNLKTFDDQLTAAEKKWDAEMAPFAGAAIIPYHESWSYFARAFRLTIPTTIENKPGFAPSPSRVQEVINIAKKEKGRAIVTEPCLRALTLG